MSDLIITNGDVVAAALGELRPAATVLAWRDALHEGPVPAVDAATLRAIRADWLADGTLHTREGVLADLAARDRTVAGHARFDRVELWFEHDLYDQLQLVQALDMLAAGGRRADVLLVQSPRHLGPMQPEQLARLDGLAMPVNEAMFATATRVWRAFGRDTPEAFAAARHEPIAGLLFLGQAMTRMLEELPGADGLGRSERQILYSIDRGVTRVGPLFARVSNMEEAAFLGDWSFFRVLSGLAFAEAPLLCGLPEPFRPALLADDDRRKALITAPVALSALGQAVLAGRADRARAGPIDLWVGGTHVTSDNLWRWDHVAQRLIGPPA